jgi:hypothetical protein
LSFVDKTVNGGWYIPVSLIQYFQRDWPVIVGIPRKIDGSHATPPQEPFNTVPSDLLPI